MYGPLLAALEGGATVVAANNRLARHLRLQYGRHQLDRGRQAWPSPDILPWRGWITGLWEASVVGGGAAGRHVLLTDHQQHFVWMDIIGQSGLAGALSDVAALADAAGHAWALLHDWQLDLTELEAAATTADHRAFVAWAVNYTNRCQARRWSDTAALPQLLLTNIRNGSLSGTTVCFLGFEVWAPGRNRLRAALEQGGAIIIDAEPPNRSSSAVRVACPDPISETELAARWARSRLAADPTADVGVVIPDLSRRADEVRRIFLDVFAPDWRISGADQAAPVNFSYGRSLAEFGLVHSALTAIGLAEPQIDYRALGQLLRSPYLRGGVHEASQRATADLRIREFGDPEPALSAVSGLLQQQAPGFHAMLARCRAAGRVAGKLTPGGWCSWFSERLDELGWPGERGLDSAEHQTVKAWHDLLRSFAACDSVAGPMTLGTARSMLGRLAAQQLFQPEKGQHAVQVLGVLESSGHRFDHLWVCGMAAEDWPASPRPNPLIPLSVQRRAGLPGSSPELARDFAGVLTRRLLASAADIVMSWPQARDDDALSPSSLIRELPETSIEAIEVWSEPLYNRRLLVAGELEQVGADAPPPVPADARIGGGAGLLASQAVCPARAFLQYRLGAREIPLPGIGIDARLRGKLVHRVLEKFFERIVSRQDLAAMKPSQIDAQLGELIDSAILSCFGQRQGLMAELLRLEAERLRPLLAEYLGMERERADFVVEQRELNQRVNLGGLEIRLRLDRLDRLADGSVLVIDYKTGKASASGWAADRPSDPQMPAYATAIGAEALALVQLRSGDIRYIGVGQPATGIRGIKAPLKFTGGVIGSWNDLVDRWRNSLEQIAGEFVAGDFRIDPANPGSAQGQYSILSRVHELDQYYRYRGDD